MPDSQPAKISTKEPGLQELVRQLNVIIKDIYRWVDYMRGIRNNTFEPQTIGDHNHQASDQGGDYAWADLLLSDVAYLQALRAAIVVSNLLDKTASEEISGTYKLTALTASTLLALNASKEIQSLTKGSHIVDATTGHAVTDPGDSPATADVLRDDLVDNTIPSIETALNNLGTKVNSILSALENAGILNTS